MVPVIEKDRDLLARVAVDNPHLAGTVLRLCNVLEDAQRYGELPSADLLRELGEYLRDLGQLVIGKALVASRPDYLVVSGNTPSPPSPTGGARSAADTSGSRTT